MNSGLENDIELKLLHVITNAEKMRETKKKNRETAWRQCQI